MKFAYPPILWLALAVTLSLSGFLFWAWRKRKFLIAQFVQSRLLAQLTVGVSARRQKLRLALLVFAVACLFLALARPQWGFEWEEAHQRGLDILVAIDTSRSMLAQDIAPNRLARAKLAALDLMNEARSDRLGLIAFAGTAFFQCPLTIDQDAFRQSVEALKVGIIPQGGTALADAIRTATQAFSQDSSNYKALVMFTDGEDHEAGTSEAAQKAAQAGIRIFTVGVGTPAGELLRQIDAHGNVTFIKDDAGNVVKSRLNQALLLKIATTTHGAYLHLGGTDSMEQLYRKSLALLPKSELASRLTKRFHERFQWPLALGMLGLLLEMFVPEQRRVRRPTSAANVENRELKQIFTAGMFFLLAFPQASAASSGSASDALRDYRSGRYDEAQQTYEALLDKHPKDRRYAYNAGNAAFRGQDYSTAARYFSQATLAPKLDLQESAFYNLGNTQYYLGQDARDSQQCLSHWQEAVQDFQSALRLNPKDADAKYNLDLVKKQIEKLQKKLKKNPSSNNNRQKQKNQKDNKKQEKQNQQKNSQRQSSSQSRKSQSQKSPQPEKQKPSAAKPQAAHQPKPKTGSPKKNNASARKSQANSKKSPAAKKPARAMPLGQMSRQQALKLLDAQKGDEKVLIYQPPEDSNAPTSGKNW